MAGSYSQPIKANEVISYGTRDFQHLIRTAATKRWRLTISIHVRLANCRFSLHGVRNSRFSTDSIRKAATKRGPLTIFLFMAYRTWDFQHSIRTAATKRPQQLANLDLCSPSMQNACKLWIFYSCKWLI